MMASRLRAWGSSGGSGIVVPSSVFTGGADGYWASPSTLSSQYQDSMGVTAVSAAAQSVGLQLDGQDGYVRGAELWADASTSFIGESSKVSANVYRVLSTAGAYSAVQVLGAAVVGRTYEIQFTVDSVTSGGVAVDWTGGPVFTTTGAKSCRVVASATALLLRRNAGVSDVQVSNVSYREIPGNHAVQATSLSRPTLQTVGAYYSHLWDELDDNLATSTGGGGTTAFLYCAAVRPNSAGTSRTLWSDAGTNTGYRVRITSANVLQLSAGNGTAFTSVVSLETLASGTTYVVTAWHDGTNLSVQVNNGATVSVAFAAATAGTAGFTEAKDNGAASAFFGGYLFDRVYVKNSTITATQREGIKRYVASYAGVTL